MTTIRTQPHTPRHARALEMAAGMAPLAEFTAISDHTFEQSLSMETPADRILHAAMARLSGGFSPMAIAEAWFDWAVHLGTSPGRMAEIAQTGMTEAAHVMETVLETVAGRGTCNPSARSLPHDKRFRHESWQQFPFAIYAESFLGMGAGGMRRRAAFTAPQSIISISCILLDGRRSTWLPLPTSR